MPTKVVTAGSKNATPYFELSGMRTKKSMGHYPFIVFRESQDRAVIEFVDSPQALVKLPARTKVMAQWPGKYKSTFFKFTVGQLRKHIAENPKHACQVI